MSASPLTVIGRTDEPLGVTRLQNTRPTKASLPRCGAYARSTGVPCIAPPVRDPITGLPRNGRCRNHGGLSTGPKTKQGRERCSEGARRWLSERRKKVNDDEQA